MTAKEIAYVAIATGLYFGLVIGGLFGAFSVLDLVQGNEPTIKTAEPCTKPEPLIECLRSYRECANKALDEEMSRDAKLAGGEFCAFILFATVLIIYGVELITTRRVRQLNSCLEQLTTAINTREERLQALKRDK